MILDFDKIPLKTIVNFNGGEKEFRANMFIDETGNKIFVGRLIPGASIGLHTHETSSEIMYILEGSGKVLYNGEELRVKKGDAHYCPKGHTHSLINDTTKDLVFFAAVPVQ